MDIRWGSMDKGRDGVVENSDFQCSRSLHSRKL